MTNPTPLPLFPNHTPFDSKALSASNLLIKSLATHPDYAKPQRYCLFVDIDGTLAPFVLDPKASVIPATTLAILAQIQALGVVVCAVTGREVAVARTLFAPLSLPIIGSHGLEIDLHFAQSTVSAQATKPLFIHSSQFSGDLATIKQRLRQLCQAYPDLLMEEKPYSLAVHFRKTPALADKVHTSMQQLVADYPNWGLKAGKCVWEILPSGADKGTGILVVLGYLERLNASQLAEKQTENAEKIVSFCPIFIGDDVTDETGFLAVQNYSPTHYPPAHTSDLSVIKGGQGIGIKVGHEPTEAKFFVKDIAEVAIFLQQFLQFLQQPVSKYNHEDN